jgi:hypothetical protein
MMIPRRCLIQEMCRAELAIRTAIHAVEAMGCDVRLTEAIILLGQAQSKVADVEDERQ